MSLVSNFVGGISSSSFSNLESISSNFDLNDSTFSDILNKKMGISSLEEPFNTLGNLGIPAGFIIENMDYTERVIEQLETLGKDINLENEFQAPHKENKEENVTSSEVATFFTSLLENGTANNSNGSQLLDFAQKQASNMYHKFGRTMVMDLKDFVSDAKEILS